jgi:hypothetical protein
MPRILVLLALAVGLVFGSAFAQAVDVGVESAEVRQAITVEIPERYALHLTRDAWELDLNTLAEDIACYLVPKDVEFSFGTFKGYQKAWYEGVLELEPTALYPAMILDDDGNIAVGEDGKYKKGTLICFYQKLLQKFTNVPDWQLEVEFTANLPGFGNFQLMDYLADKMILNVWTNQISAGTSTDVDGTTGGWLDDILVEGFWFDGTEVANEYAITLAFTLTSQ